MANVSVPRPDKCILMAVEGSGQKPGIEAMFNPKELSIEKGTKWNPHMAAKANTPVMEFTSADPETLSLELFFDTYESGESVKDSIDILHQLTTIVAEYLRPPICGFFWGQAFRFIGVITSVSVKYTMFFRDGTPCRATASIKMTEAGTVQGTENNNSKDSGAQVGKGLGNANAARADLAAGPGGNHRKVLEANGSDTGRLGPPAGGPKGAGPGGKGQGG